MTDEEMLKTRRKMHDGLALLIRRKLRDMRRRSARPRAQRLPKEARALKSLIAEAGAVGLAAHTRGKSSAAPAPSQQRRARVR